MNRRKISAMVAAALITSQVQNIAFADTINNSQDKSSITAETINENVSKENSEETAVTSEDINEESTIVEGSEIIGEEVAEESQILQQKENNEVIEESNSNTEYSAIEEVYNLTGKLEVDLNFATPIKFTSSEKTNIKVILKNSEGNAIKEVYLGNDNTSGDIGENSIYSLSALDFKRQALGEGDNEVSFYLLTFDKLPLGSYSIEVAGSGYKTAKVSNIEIQNSSKRVLIGTTNNSVVIDNKGTEDETDDIKEEYLASFLVGDLDGNNTVNEADYEVLKSAIKSKSTDLSYDLNRDGKVDITDLTYVHSNMGTNKVDAEIKDTDLIINPENVEIAIDTEKIDVDGNIKDILKDNNSVVKLESKTEINEETPISFDLDLQGVNRTNSNIEQIVINSPAGGAPTSGSIIIGNEEFKFTEENLVKENSLARSSEEKLVINLGKQIAVSKITINITSGSRNNKNLAEIAKVEFLNNVYKELPKPKMNIPVINSFISTTQVGQESMTIGWNNETNVTGYEVKVEKLNDKNQVTSTSTYKTSENSLRIEKIEAYGVYRISIQSLSGDWKSGYKNEQDGYNENATGNTNLTNNSNDKDGVPDNVDSNYNPIAWNSESGKLSDDNANFGEDSIIEVQVIPETAPEGPEGIKVQGGYKKLTVSWKAHAKAKDYELYYRKVGEKAWLKANDKGTKYEDPDINDNIPTQTVELSDKEDFIRATSYTIEGLDDTSSYEIMMTATNHHGTGGLSKVYIGSTTKLIPPVTSNYKLINSANGTSKLTNHIVNVEFPVGNTTSTNGIVDNDYTTYWQYDDWDYGSNGPILTFDKEYTIGSLKVIRRLDVNELTYSTRIEFFNEETQKWELVGSKFNESNNGKVVNITLNNPVRTKRIRIGTSVYPSVSWGKYERAVTMSEVKVYEYDSLQSDVDNLFADDLKLELKDNVTQEMIDEFTNRAKTIDPVNLEYHPNQSEILKDLNRAQDLLNDVLLNDKIITLDSTIHNLAPQNTIGQINNYQSLGVALKPGDKVTIYIGSERKDTKFDLVLTQFNAESGTAYKVINTLSVGKNEIEIPETGFDMNYEKGGNLYIGLKSGFAESNVFKVRVSGGVEIPHLNVNNIIDDESKEAEVKEKIRTYIRELRSYVSSLPSRYPSSATIEDNSNNIYTYDPQTSILNATDIEGERIMLSLAADQVLAGIQSGLSGNEDAQVDRLYNTLLAWEQLMKVSYSQQGLLEAPIDFDGDGQITNNALDILNGKSETEYYNANRAPKNRMNIKYQRMFTGAFMYASAHHVGIGYSSIAGTMTGVPFEFDQNGNLVNSDKGQLFGWGVSHEIGHVHDISGLTYTETTNNILALITQTFNDVNESRLESFGAYEKMYDKVTSNSVGLASDILTRLGMFWQLHLAYDNDYTYKMLDLNSDNSLENDTFFAKLYRATRTNGIAVLESGQDRTAQTFIMRASDAVGKDLREFFEKWGLVASPETNIYLNNKKYPKEDKAIYYLNDEARRLRLEAGSNTSLLTMATDTKVNASFGIDGSGKQITDRSYLNQKEVPLILSVSKDSDKILGYEIIRKEATSTGTQEVVVGFVERDKNGENGLTSYIDEIDAINNRTFEYKVRAYDYNLNVTEETTLGTVKVNHDGSIAKSNWVFDTNTRSLEDISDENSGHGQVQNGSIKKINDNDNSTIYTASKATDNNGNVVSGDPYVTIDLGDSKSVIGLKYNPGQDTKKFSLKNFFSRSSEASYSPISKYEVYVSKDGKSWTKAHSGTFDTSKENTIYFNETGSNLNTQLWAYDAQYVKLVAKGATTISIAELDILGPTGDNIEIGIDNGENIYKNGVGKLKSDYTYSDGQVIPAGSIIVTGEYKGDPAFNVPLVLNENDENLALKANVILLAELPEDAELGEVAKGTWLYWITPDEQKAGNIEGSKIKAELYRYNKLDSTGAPVGQRLVSDTFLYDLPENLSDLPEIELNNSKARTLSSENTSVVEINSDVIKNIFNNRK
ncbi:hypothetical protein H9660_12350 [Clostridium sp. Sa3CUN1]|uniref:Fibronectin type III domain protein n=1 Tax=Clostridium gallinarum TaxID=2762246 RepID=A0ABR8Q681_9CLOT|nr:M60 family metallopeptidase [Clostridium gallinarum]MBD7915937.1 hypothetical protein [Clostridium gallinarum]